MLGKRWGVNYFARFVPYLLGPTHPSNDKLYCRAHHLLKGLLHRPDRMGRSAAARRHHRLDRPDGTHLRHRPGGGLIFPALKQSTGELDTPAAIDVPDADRGAMMPRRKQTREMDRRDRILQERRERTELIAEEERQRQAWLAANYEPPPF
jgi:hypothetical protein